MKEKQFVLPGDPTFKLDDPGLSALDSIDLAPLLDLDFTQGRPYAHRIVNKTAATATRASSANRYWLQPADDVGTNVLRYAQNSAIDGLNGLLVEGADQNVALHNTIYNVANWTPAGAMTVTDDTTVDLYGGHSFKCVSLVITNYLYQTVALTAVKYIVECLVYTDGSAVTSADMQMQANATAAGPAVIATTFEHVGGGVYLAWGVFTATAANWNIGVGVKAGKTIYCSMISCYLAAPTNEGGDFPRSPIPNATGAAVTRAVDVLTIPADDNVGLIEGTIDVVFTAPAAESAVAQNLRALQVYKDASNRIELHYTAAADSFDMYYIVGGVVRSAGGALTCARGDVIGLRAVYDPAATNKLILYGKKNSGAWSTLGTNANALGGTFPTGATIHIGADNASTRHLSSFIRRMRFFKYAKVGLPGDF